MKKSVLYLLTIISYTSCVNTVQKNHHSEDFLNENTSISHAPTLQKDSVMANIDLIDIELELDKQEERGMVLPEDDIAVDIEHARANPQDAPQSLNSENKIPNSAGVSPPSKILHLKIAIQNKQSCPMWYILPSKGEINLNATGKFISSEIENPNCFLLQSYQGENTNLPLKEIHFEGKDKHSFRAILLSPGKVLTIRNYPLVSWKDTDHIDIASSPYLMVDDKTSLEEWFSKNFINIEDITVHCNKGESCLLEQEVLDIGNKNIAFIQARQYRMYKLPLQ